MDNGKQKDTAAVRYEPRETLWPREIERFLERAWIPRPAIRRWRRPWMPEEWVPDMDIFESAGKVVIRADLPGTKREDIQVRVEGDRLIVHGHREKTEEVKEKGYYHNERRTGAFTRAIPLPAGFNPEAIEATYNNGLLEVTIPMPAAAEPKPIQIPVR